MEIEEQMLFKILNIVSSLLTDAFYIFILIPLIFISLSVTYQMLRYPDRIPDIFGYKFFMVFDQTFDESLKYGDLAITKNIDSTGIRENDVIAYRSKIETVEIRKISAIGDNSDVTNIRFEGKLVKSIPMVGIIIYIIQQPLIMICLIIIILMMGDMAYMVAYDLDMKDLEAMSL